MAKGVKINPKVIRWAVQASNKDFENLQHKFSKLNLWINETSELSANEVNKLSKELKIPFGYFFLSKPPEEQISLLKYRTIDNEQSENPSRELIDTIKTMETKQRFMRDSTPFGVCRERFFGRRN